LGICLIFAAIIMSSLDVVLMEERRTIVWVDPLVGVSLSIFSAIVAAIWTLRNPRL
jgi:hypothetical protein